MAERRAIKSAIWDDPWFGRLPPFEMVVWIGLFSKCADDQGRFQDDPALIRSKLFPYQDVAISSIEAALNVFDGHMIRYKKGERLAQLVRWFDNQPMQYAVPSNFPPPDGWVDRYRTNWKRVQIVWNWGEIGNTQAGILLWEGLSILERSSSWITYLARLNLNLNPNLNSNPNPLTTTKPAPPPPAPADPNFSNCDDPIAYNAVLALTQWATIAMTPDNIVNLRNITAIAIHHKNDLVDYLRPFYLEWNKRYPNSNRISWAEWATTGKIPNERKGATGKVSADVPTSQLKGREFLARRREELANGTAK